MTLRPLPALADNYIWMLHDGRDALVVDPGDAAVVLHALQQDRLQLRGILVTHHHADHVDGVAELRDRTAAVVYGPTHEPMPEPICRVEHGQHIVCMGLDILVIGVPGHTLGHLAYFCTPMHDDPIVFCGDTLFSAGCGRVFEGTPEQMEESLKRVMAFPDATRVCCAHEYTLANLRFAATVEPDNENIVQYADRCRTCAEQGIPTLPSTIGLERSINPFVRTQHPGVVASARQYNAIHNLSHGVFATLRQWKNHF